MLPTWYLITMATVFGLIFGSFLNVVIFRVPAGQSLMGRSHCPRCGHQIRAKDNIPVLSWMLLHAKCRDCSQPISKRYPLVEAATGLAWAGLTAWRGWDPILPLLLFLATMLIALAMIDFDTMRLPDVLTIPSAVVTVVYLFVLSRLSHGNAEHFTQALWGGLIYLMFFLALWLLTGGRGLGFGDVKLAPTLGLMVAWFSLESVFVGILAAFVVGGLPAGIAMAAGIFKKGAKIPFGPMLILGAWVAVLWGQDIIHWYLGVTGLA